MEGKKEQTLYPKLVRTLIQHKMHNELAQFLSARGSNGKSVLEQVLSTQLHSDTTLQAIQATASLPNVLLPLICSKSPDVKPLRGSFQPPMFYQVLQALDSSDPTLGLEAFRQMGEEMITDLATAENPSTSYQPLVEKYLKLLPRQERLALLSLRLKQKIIRRKIYPESPGPLFRVAGTARIFLCFFRNMILKLWWN